MIFEAREIVVRYTRDRRPAICNVSMRVPSASLYVVLGPNGSGKTTLLRALLGSVPLVGGTVQVDGKPVRSWTRRKLARSVGVVAQAESVTFPISVREFVAMGRYPYLGAFRGEGPDDARAVRTALEQCDALELADRWLGTLSGGELQRIRIARALSQEPRALVLDEPTASLDMRHQMAIMSLLRASAENGLTVILVTHSMDLAARFADRLLLLESGTVAAEGSPAAVLREEVLRQVYRWPVAVREDPVTGYATIIPLSSPHPTRHPPA